MSSNYSFNVVLFNPQIPPNTGNIIRLCANTGSSLHLIRPLGFKIDAKSLRRAGMDYAKEIKINIYKNIDDFSKKNKFKRFFLVTKYGKERYDRQNYQIGDCFIFGSEISGLSDSIYEKYIHSPKISIPMKPNNRSINLANAVSICIYEAWKQNNFNF